MSVKEIGTLNMIIPIEKSGLGNFAADGSFDFGTYPRGSYSVQLTMANGKMSPLARQRVEPGKGDKNEVEIP